MGVKVRGTWVVECPPLLEEEGAILRAPNGQVMEHKAVRELIRRLEHFLQHACPTQVAQYNSEKAMQQQLEVHTSQRQRTPSWEKDSKGVVYCITDATGLVKIGQSKDWRSRHSSLVSSNPTVKVLHVIPTNDLSALESYLHELFQDKRVKGEWFALSDEDVEQIKTVTA